MTFDVVEVGGDALPYKDVALKMLQKARKNVEIFTLHKAVGILGGFVKNSFMISTGKTCLTVKHTDNGISFCHFLDLN